MDKLKEQFKKDFEKSDKPELSFDLRQLEPNTKEMKHRIKPLKAFILGMAWLIGIFISLPTAAFLIMSLRIDESVKFNNKNYSMNQLQIAQSNTFKKLNDVTYPSGGAPIVNDPSLEEEEAYSSFCNATYHSLVNASKQDNMSYSAVGLYSNLNELANASSREDLSNRLNELLGLDAAERATFYEKIMKANSFADEDTTIQLKNAAFFDDRYDHNIEFVNSLAKLYCEAYQLDFDKDASRIVDWVNAAVNSKGFIDKDFLAMDEETTLYLFSTLYFKNAWSHKYIADDTKDDDFHLANGSTIKTPFMSHSYLADYYCDFGSYISVRDYYHRGNASVTYLVPKKAEDNIFELTKDANIFEEKEENKICPSVKEDDYSHINAIMVNLRTPKFKLKCDVDFKDCLKGLGFESMFNRQVDSFRNAFSGDNIENVNFYLQNVKQRNEVEFNEDGSTVKSVSMASFGAATAAAPMQPDGTLDVDLNQPFIYIIRDVNDNPIFVGHVDNPRV